MRTLFFCCPVVVACCFPSLNAGQLRAEERVELSQLTLRATDGEAISLPESEFTVLCFLGTECPLAKLYAGRLQELADRFAKHGVAFLGVNSNLQDSPAEIDGYVRRHKLRFPMAKDADQSVAAALSAERTPQVFLLNSVGEVLYRGRIDDQYEPGISRKAPTEHHLADVLAAATSGQKIAVARTTPVGCLITRIQKADSDQTGEPSSAVTFNRDIAPILNRHCVECHRQDEIAPMALTDYHEVVGWGQMILEVIDQKRMPPWHADPAVGHFLGARTFPAEGRNTIEQWINSGMPEGAADDLPDSPQWAGGWHFADSPDEEFEMPRSFAVPSEGTVEYQYFVVDPSWKEDVWVRAAQVLPGDASVVHHCIVFVRPPDGSGLTGTGWLGAYVPGQRTFELPPGHARQIPAGSKFVFQMHYTPNGHATNDRSKLGIWKLDQKEVTHRVATQIAIEHRFEIPPNTSDHKVTMNFSGFPKQSKMLGLTPHMHLRGKAFRAAAEFDNGKRQPLLNVPAYDFNWQHWYAFHQPVSLDNVSSLKFEVTFDNSHGNPTNPNPKEYVSWGDQTWEEMAVAFFDIATPVGVSDRRIWKSELSANEVQATHDAATTKRVTEFLERLDRNDDGEVTEDEVPAAFKRFAFRDIDRNRDGRLIREEIKRAAARR